MNALVKGEQMNPKQRNWLVLHLLHPERLKQSAMKKKSRAERSGSERMLSDSTRNTCADRQS